jgi:hypothetical protein
MSSNKQLTSKEKLHEALKVLSMAATYTTSMPARKAINIATEHIEQVMNSLPVE